MFLRSALGEGGPELNEIERFFCIMFSIMSMTKIPMREGKIIRRRIQGHHKYFSGII